MTPAGSLVAESLGPGAVLASLLDDDLDLTFVGHLLHPEVGDVDVGSLGVAHLDLVLEGGVVLEEISDLFIVDFKKRCLQEQGLIEQVMQEDDDLRVVYNSNFFPSASV